MDKILQSAGRGHNVTVTNDGATILKSLHIDNPAAKVLVDISRVQDDKVGDGTISVVVLAGELLREAEKLVNTKIHPMTIISGHGGSGGLHAYVPSLDYAVNDMKTFINKVLAENPKLPCFCFGHSTGGAIVLKETNVQIQSFPI